MLVAWLQMRKSFLQTLSGLVTNSSDYRNHRHREEQLIAGLQKLAESEGVEHATRGFARDICVELGGNCSYRGKLGVDY